MAITTSIVWSINKPLRDSSDGFVTQTEYSLIGQTKNGTVGIATFQMDQIIRFNTSMTGSEIPFDDLSPAQVLDWVKTSIGSTEVAHLEKLMHDNLIWIHSRVPKIGTEELHSNPNNDGWWGVNQHKESLLVDPDDLVV